MSHAKKAAKPNPQGRQPGTYIPDSLPTRLTELDVGECEAKSVRFPVTEMTAERVSQESERMSNALRAAVRRASDRSGYEYLIETGFFNTKNDHVIVLSVVTRTA